MEAEAAGTDLFEGEHKMLCGSFLSKILLVVP